MNQSDDAQFMKGILFLMKVSCRVLKEITRERIDGDRLDSSSIEEFLEQLDDLTKLIEASARNINEINLKGCRPK